MADLFQMWMPAAIRRRILQHLFENGVLAVSDIQTGHHEELDCLNIYPYQIGRSMVSKGMCKKTYAWRTAYYTLNEKGVEYIRGLFGIPADVAPLSHLPANAETLNRNQRPPKKFGNDRPPRRQFNNRKPAEETQ